MTIVRAPFRNAASSPFRNGASSPCSDGGVNLMLGLIVLAGVSVGFFFTWTKLQNNTGRDLTYNSVGHLLDFIWKG